VKVSAGGGLGWGGGGGGVFWGGLEPATFLCGAGTGRGRGGHSFSASFSAAVTGRGFSGWHRAGPERRARRAGAVATN